MDRDTFEKLGDKHKRFEEMQSAFKLLPGVPFIVRLDGNAFHTFTKGMDRPYDARMSESMVETTIKLVERFNADVGYTQSDEITLAFNPKNDILFDGRIIKICTIMSSYGTAVFNKLISSKFEKIPSSVEYPVFDARAFNVPSVEDLVENLIWRQTDASRNSLTMACHAHFSNSELHKAGYAKKHDMLHSIGLNWNDYPYHFKRGTFVKRVRVEKDLDAKTLAKIPENKRPTGPVIRNVVTAFDGGVLESLEPNQRHLTLF